MPRIAEQKELTTPPTLFAAVAGAVEDHAEHRVGQASVLGCQRGQVRVVVLDVVQGDTEVGGARAQARDAYPGCRSGDHQGGAHP